MDNGVTAVNFGCSLPQMRRVADPQARRVRYWRRVDGLNAAGRGVAPLAMAIHSHAIAALRVVHERPVDPHTTLL